MAYAAEDIKGLTPSQIQNKFSLPSTPKFVVDVELEAGTRIRTGTANSLFGFDGGGQQFDLFIFSQLYQLLICFSKTSQTAQ